MSGADRSGGGRKRHDSMGQILGAEFLAITAADLTAFDSAARHSRR